MLRISCILCFICLGLIVACLAKQNTLLSAISVLCLSLTMMYMLSIISAFERYTVPTNLIKTVAHIPVDDTKFELYYKDIDADVAYYTPINGFDLLDAGSTVKFYDGTETVVESSDTQGFTIFKPDNFTASGKSGTVVLDPVGNTVGVVSQLVGKDRIYCIWN